MVQRSVPAPFLTKTYRLVDDPATDDVVSWSGDGTTFIVWKTAEFAQDLLPTYFKHSNFSSFIRQLNTYGFRKTVPDKWEFANDSFKRGQMELLIGIRRRKTASLPKPADAKQVNTGNPNSPESSGDDLGSSSTSSPNSKNPCSSATETSAQLADLSGENAKLRKNNQMLSSELAHTRRQCDELIAFLTQCANGAPEEISRIMQSGDEISNCDDGEKENCMKLFGVVVRKKKWGCHENSNSNSNSNSNAGEQSKRMKTSLPWMKMISASPAGESKVCN